MISRSKKLGFAFLAAVLFSTLPLSLAIADENSTVSQEKLSKVETNCLTIKQNLKRVQNSDRNTRVSIGRTFQSILNSYITPLNVRLVKNNHSNVELNNIQNRYAEARETFNRDYINYSKELEALISFDCKSDPEGFYKQLEQTRTKRLVVSESVSKIQVIINEHVEAVKDIRNNFDRFEDNNE